MFWSTRGISTRERYSLRARIIFIYLTLELRKQSGVSVGTAVRGLASRIARPEYLRSRDGDYKRSPTIAEKRRPEKRRSAWGSTRGKACHCHRRGRFSSPSRPREIKSFREKIAKTGETPPGELSTLVFVTENSYLFSPRGYISFEIQLVTDNRAFDRFFLSIVFFFFLKTTRSVSRQSYRELFNKIFIVQLSKNFALKTRLAYTN